MKKILIWLLCLGLGYGLYQAAITKLKDGFSPHKIQGELAYSKEKEIPKEILQILSQPFSYLGKGSQMYAFVSQDGRYVLKFFRQSRYRMMTLPLLPSFLSKIQDKRLKEKLRKKEYLFESCRIAYFKLREESGLIYLHLNKTDHLHRTVTLYDRLKRPFSLDLDQHAFFIQRKGEQMYPYLQSFIKNGRKESAKMALDDLAKLLSHRFKKGIADSDSVIQKNSGFCNGKAMFLDIGQFSLNPSLTDPTIAAREGLKDTDHFRQWLKEQDEELAAYFEQSLQGSDKQA